MGFLTIFLTLLLFTLNLRTVIGSQESNLETYIVRVEGPFIVQPTSSSFMDDLQRWYHSFLPTTISSSNEEPRIIYSYRNVLKGFAARLSPEQVKAMEKMPGFVSARPQKTIPLHTTHSPNFLGLSQNSGYWDDSNYGKGVIIGVLDSGITPDHPSFNDKGMPPPPAKWRGKCEFNSLMCNNKLIGARSYTGDGTPSDNNGHGTHTASTAAGNFVSDANVFGNANGTAAGVAPLAHIAIYKVGQTKCSESYVLAAMDAAIDDGVDVLSLSLGRPAKNFFEENIAIGAFRAMEKGIFVSCSAGNTGPSPGTIENGAPWVLTVGASTIDRKIRATAVLGNMEQLDGESNFQPAGFGSTFLPLIYPGMESTDPNATFCFPESLSKIDVKGKIVLCLYGGGIGRIAKGSSVRNAGGAAMILINQQPHGYSTFSDSHVLPATHLSYADGIRIKAYLNSTTAPVATILFKGTIIGDKSSPMVASFSSRGPNIPSPGILKPDIIGPGANILAAWNESIEGNTDTKSNFNIISGTSMSCPHLSGIAALLKKTHPEWSPAAIKSAIMTTANQVNLAGALIDDQTQRPANVFATGSGHVNIMKANDPGLVYDLSPEDYIPYLCGLRYTDQQIGYIVNRAVNCSRISSIPEAELNYPSFSVFLGASSQTYRRTVTNVGEAKSIYKVEIGKLQGATVTVKPVTMRFSRLNRKLTYRVKFNRLALAVSNVTVQGFLTWKSAKHSVRSPIVVTFL